MRSSRKTKGFTLVELLLVVAVLVILAGLVLPQMHGVQENSAAVGGVASLQAIRDAIMGSDRGAGYLGDLGRLPLTMRDLFAMPAGATAYEASTGRGWRGPYLQDAITAYHVSVTNGFTAAYGNEGDPAAADPWGRAIILQAPTVAATAAQRDLFTRLVSAGPDGIVQTPADVLYPETSLRGDDLVLFLKRPDIAP